MDAQPKRKKKKGRRALLLIILLVSTRRAKRFDADAVKQEYMESKGLDQ